MASMIARTLWFLRIDIRSRWRQMLLLAATTTLAALAVLTPALIAYRTSTAFPLRLAAAAAGQAVINGPERELPFDDATLRVPTVADLPGVLSEERYVGILSFFPEIPWLTLEAELGNGGEVSGPGPATFALYSATSKGGVVNERPVVTKGRLPDPARPDELFVSPRFAAAAGWSIGSSVRIQVVTGALAATDPSTIVDIAETARSVTTERTMTVVGLGDLAGSPRNAGDGTVIATPAFVAATDAGIQYSVSSVHLAPGTSVAAVIDAANLMGDGQFSLFEDRRSLRTTYADSVRPDVVSLTIFAALTATVAALVLANALAREARLGLGDTSTRRAVGMTATQMVTIALGRVALVVGAGSLVAIPIATALSTRWLGESARAVEPPRTHGPVGWIGLGVAAALAATTLLVATPGIVGAVRRRTRLWRRSWIAARVAAAGAPAPCVVGARNAFEPARRDAALPARTAVAVAVLAGAVAVGAATFASSLDRFLARPASYGVTWDAVVGSSFDPQRDCDADDCDPDQVIGARTTEIETYLHTDANVSGFSASTEATVFIDGVAVPITAIGAGPVRPVIVEGVEPRDDEIALGQREMSDHHLRIGDLVPAGDGPALRVVGVTLTPAATDRGAAVLGRGGVVTPATAHRLNGQAMSIHYLVQTDRPAAIDEVISRFEVAFPTPPDAFTGERQAAQITIDDYRRIRSTPTLLAVVLAGLAGATLVLGLATSMRRRARDFAVLRALGCTRRQLAAAITWQVVFVVGSVVVLATPVGLIAASGAWSALEERIGTASRTSWPLLPLLAALAAGLIIMLAVALVTSRRVVGVRVAESLNKE